MTKHGSNDLKKRARELAAAEQISYTQALERLRAGTGTAGAAKRRSAAERWRRHGQARPGFHWHFTAGSNGLRLDVPDVTNRVWADRLAPLALDKWSDAVPRFTADQEDLVLTTLREAFGRTGREVVEYVDVEVRLDQVETAGRLALTWAGLGLAHCTEHESWTTPRLVACEPVAGGLLLKGEGPQRRVTWAPGTVLRVNDIPRPALSEQPQSAYDIVASSNDDPNDELRRAGHTLLGMRYRQDIPPAPADAVEGRPPTLARDWPASLRSVPTDYPHGGLDDRLHIDTDAGLAYVQRSAFGGFYSEYVVPLTTGRAALIDAYEEAFVRSPSAYATAGTNPEAAAALAGTPYTPHHLYRLLGCLAVVDAADARALLARTEDQWAADGWPLNPAIGPVFQPHHESADPSKCWRASEAARLADAGIGMPRAYELRADGKRVPSLEEALAADLTVITDAGRFANELLEKAADAVPDRLAAELPTARTHTREELENWKNDHRSLFGPQGEGVSVDLVRHDFTLPDGTTRSLWAMGEGWWYYDEDADAGHDVTIFLSEAAARSAWRDARDAHRESDRKSAEPAPELPCPGPAVRHCDNCGSTTVKPNEFLELGWMSASLGLACSPACYDDMSDGPGRHARRHHRD